MTTSGSHGGNTAPLIENHTVDYVPLAERHGKARDLFTLWFSTNIAPLPIVTGAMVVQVFHLNLLWGLIAIALGHMIGGVVIALASAQGPRMGIPQMVQSRGQFGRYGALLIVFFAALIYVGFFISNIVLAGQSIHGMMPSVPLPVGVLIGALSATAIGVIGYRFIHTLNRIGTWVMGAALLAGFIMIFSQDLPLDFFSRGSFNLSGWLATLCLGIIWQISFSPYVSDYSRYLPSDIGIAKPFWATYFGATLGTILSFSFGAVAVLATPEGTEAMAAVKQSTGMLGPILMLLFLLNIISHNALNLYGAVLSIVTSSPTVVKARAAPRTSLQGVKPPWCSTPPVPARGSTSPMSPAASSRCSTASRAASRAAGSRLVAVRLPPDMGPAGKAESPKRTSMVDGGTPSSSAMAQATTLLLPLPMSWQAQRATRPSGPASSRTWVPRATKGIHTELARPTPRR